MLKRILSFSLCLFTFSTFAVAPNAADLKKAMDEFNYSIAVEWDQKDLAFVSKKRDELFQTFTTLKKQGLSSADILSFATSNLTKTENKTKIQELETQYNIGLLNDADLADQVANVFKADAAKGASWNGDAVALAAMSVFAVGILAFMVASIVTANKNPDTAPQTGFYCHEKTCQWDFVGQYSCSEGTGPECP